LQLSDQSREEVKRLILSRKGFDAKAGGSASPILEDGRIFSLPIPQNFPSPKRYKDLNFDGISGAHLLKETQTSLSPYDYCHFDPMLNEDIGIFGQARSSQTELKNNRVSSGDLFLFFGWFRNFRNKGDDLHHLFGWLQIEQVIEGSKEIKSFLKEANIEHPHGYGDTSRYKNNTIYVGKRNLDIFKKNKFIKGHGLFKYTHEDLILTEKRKTRSRWKLPKEYFANSEKLFLNRLKWQDEEEYRIFYKGFGQEFILNAEENPKIVDWAYSLIEKHG
jgi:hypothetical protein